MSTSGKKTAPLRVNVPIVKSGRPPRYYMDFDEYVSDGEELRLLERRIYVTPAEYSKHPELQFWARNFAETAWGCFEAFDAARKHFERDEVYERRRRADGDNHEIISRRFVTEQVALLVGAFTQSPPSPGVYTRMLVEEIRAARPNASAAEATCRVIRRTSTFLPAVAEVLKVLRDQMKLWDERFCIHKSEIECWCKRAAEKENRWEAQRREQAARRALAAPPMQPIEGEPKVRIPEYASRSIDHD
jgi:hypothetical protein